LILSYSHSCWWFIAEINDLQPIQRSWVQIGRKSQFDFMFSVSYRLYNRHQELRNCFSRTRQTYHEFEVVVIGCSDFLPEIVIATKISSYQVHISNQSRQGLLGIQELHQAKGELFLLFIFWLYYQRHLAIVADPSILEPGSLCPDLPSMISRSSESHGLPNTLFGLRVHQRNSKDTRNIQRVITCGSVNGIQSTQDIDPNKEKNRIEYSISKKKGYNELFERKLSSIISGKKQLILFQAGLFFCKPCDVSRFHPWAIIEVTYSNGLPYSVFMLPSFYFSSI